MPEKKVELSHQFFHRIDFLRQQSGLSERGLRDRAGVNVDTIRSARKQFDAGTQTGISSDAVEKLAKALKLGPKELALPNWAPIPTGEQVLAYEILDHLLAGEWRHKMADVLAEAIQKRGRRGNITRTLAGVITEAIKKHAWS